jgi:hypothetical protein
MGRYLAPQSEVIGPLSGGEFLLEDVIDSFFFGPLQVPAWSIDLTPLAVLQGFEDAVVKGGLEGDVGT